MTVRIVLSLIFSKFACGNQKICDEEIQRGEEEKNMELMVGRKGSLLEICTRQRNREVYQATGLLVQDGLTKRLRQQEETMECLRSSKRPAFRF